MSLGKFYYKKNRLQQLRGFYFTALLKSISAAAKELSLSQSAITMQIQSLEQDLDVALFDRTNRKQLVLTEDGKQLYTMAAPFIQGVDGVCDRFLNLRARSIKKTLHIAAHHMAILHLLPAMLAKFLAHNPKIKIKLHNISASEAASRLISEKLDFMLYPNTPERPEYFLKGEFIYDPMLIMPPDHPLAALEIIGLEDIAKHNLIRIDAELITLPMFEEACKTYGWGGNISFEDGDWIMLKQFVRAGLGVAMVSGLCVDATDQEITGRSMSHLFPRMNYSFAIKKGRILSQHVEEFLNLAAGLDGEES